MEQKRKMNKKLSWGFTVISIGELAGALAVVAYGLLKGNLTETTCSVIMGAALVLYWLLEDIAEPIAEGSLCQIHSSGSGWIRRNCMLSVRCGWKSFRKQQWNSRCGSVCGSDEAKAPESADLLRTRGSGS